MIRRILVVVLLGLGLNAWSFEEDATYCIQHVETGKYLLLDTQPNDGSVTSAAQLSETSKTLFYITSASNTDCYYMQDSGTQYYMSSWYNAANYNNVVAITEAREVKIESGGEEDIYYLRRSASSTKYFGVDEEGYVTSNFTTATQWRIVKVDDDPGEETDPKLKITEVMASNLGEAQDPSYNFGAWVELYNPGSATVKLNGMTVSDGKGNTFQLTTYHGNVPAGGYKNLWFGHYSADNTHYSSSYKTYKGQVDLKLDCDGGSLSIAKNGVVLDSIDYPEAVSRCSWAMKDDGSWSYCAWPTPEKSNQGAQFAGERYEDPVPDQNGGLFQGNKTLKVAVPEGATLIYTTDGSFPTSQNGTEASVTDGEAQFTFSGTKCFRFRCIGDDRLPSRVVTRSFIESSKTGMGVLSLVTNDKYLNDNTIGIYVQGTNNGSTLGGWSYWSYANYYQDWDRPCNVEIYDADMTLLVSQEANMSMSGGLSRTKTKKSFKLKTGKVFDGLNFYQLQGLYPQKPYNRYKDIMVRAGGDTDQDVHIDNVLQQVAGNSGTYVDWQAYRPVEVFFNGEDKGFFFVREVSNKQYGAANYGMDSDTMDTFEENDIIGMSLSAGSWDAFNELYDEAKSCQTDDMAWERVKELLDIDEFINYLAVECFTCNYDWPQNNFKMFRDEKDGRFHAVVQDLDWAFGTTSPFSRIEEQNSGYYYAESGWGSNRQDALICYLMNREEFRRQFVDAYCLMAYSVYGTEHVDETFSTITSECSAYDTGSSLTNIKSKLTSQRAASLLSDLKSWSRAKLSSATSVTAAISSNITDAGITLNGLQIPYANFDGTLFLPATLEAKAPKGYKFDGWVKDGSICSASESVTMTAGGTYVAQYSVDEDWQKKPVVVNEVGAKNGVYIDNELKHRDWIELYNTTDKSVDVAGMYLSDDISEPEKWQIETTAESGTATVIPAHGHLIVWGKLPNDDNSLVVLTSADYSWCDTLRYNAQNERQSVGRYPDGGKEIYLFDMPTIDKINMLTSCAQLQEFPEPVPTAVNEMIGNGKGSGNSLKDGMMYDLQGRRTDGIRHQSIVVKDGYLILTPSAQ